MAIATKIGNVGDGQYVFWCPGCATHHYWNEKWRAKWDGDDFANLTISPSILVRTYGDGAGTCHMFVERGRIRYLHDCTHSLAGQTVDMVDLEEV